LAFSVIDGLRERSNAPAEPIFGEVLNRGDAMRRRDIVTLSARREEAFTRRARTWAKASHLIDCFAKQPER
jgi:hypothetical protein